MLTWALMALSLLEPAILLETATSRDPIDIAVVRPVDFHRSLADWIQQREKQGYRFHFVDSHFDSRVVRDRLLKVSNKPGVQLKFVVLAADAPSVALPPLPEQAKDTVPTFYLDAKVVQRFGSEPQIATDLPYSDLDDDGIPELSIGRIPADNPQQLKDYLRRVLRYELENDAGEWRNRLEVVAGVGGFGMLVDTTIEMVTRKFLTDGIPDSYTLGMTYASLTSPYCPNPFEFSRSAIASLNRGSMFWIYIGHGYINTLDRFSVLDRYEEILNTNMLEQVRVEHGPPVALFLACYTGAFDAPVDSLAESLLMLPQGPVACLAGTRMTMPYGMSCLGAEMLKGCFEDRADTLGQLIVEAKQRSVVDSNALDSAKTSPQRKLLDTLATTLGPQGHSLADERREHLALIHLLGDPTLHLRYPESIKIKAPEKLAPGEKIDFTIESPISSGTATVELLYRRDRLPAGIRAIKDFDAQPETLQQMDRNYSAANQLVVVAKQIDVRKGKFEGTFEIPKDVAGRFVIRCIHRSNDRWASGSTLIEIRKPRASKS